MSSYDENIPADFVLSDELAEALLGRPPKKDEYVTINQKYDKTRTYVFNRDGDVTDCVDTPKVYKDIDTVNLYRERCDTLKKRNRHMNIVFCVIGVMLIAAAVGAFMLLRILV